MLNNAQLMLHVVHTQALGGAAGGYTCGSEQLIGILRQRCHFYHFENSQTEVSLEITFTILKIQLRSRPYSFSNSLPPPVVGCASKVKCHCYYLPKEHFVSFNVYFLFLPFEIEVIYYNVVVACHEISLSTFWQILISAWLYWIALVRFLTCCLKALSWWPRLAQIQPGCQCWW